jgi:hypothetical protein
MSCREKSFKEKIMGILKKSCKSVLKKDASTFLGLRIPKKEASYLALYCLANGKSKTSIVHKLLFKWITDAVQKGNTEDFLIDEIVEKVSQIWKDTPKRNINNTSFKSNLSLEFKYKGLDPSIADIIIKKL